VANQITIYTKFLLKCSNVKLILMNVRPTKTLMDCRIFVWVSQSLTLRTMNKMKMAQLREVSRSYGSVLDQKERGAAHPLSKSSVAPGLVIYLAVGRRANPNSNNTVLLPGDYLS
jgi:hypothetical protein